MRASIEGDIEVVKALFDKGADVNAKNNYGGTALLMASWNNRFEVLQSFVGQRS